MSRVLALSGTLYENLTTLTQCFADSSLGNAERFSCTFLAFLSYKLSERDRSHCCDPLVNTRQVLPPVFKQSIVMMTPGLILGS